MSRGPVIIFLTILMFVGRVCLANQEHANTVRIAPSANNTNITNNINDNKNEKFHSSINKTSDEKETSAVASNTGKPNVNESSSTSKNNTKVNQQQHVDEPLDKKKHVCNSTKESDDMVNCKVSPHDDDDDDVDNDSTEKSLPSSTTDVAVTTTTVSKKSETDSAKSQTPIVSQNTTEKVKEASKEPEIESLDSSENPHQASYDVHSDTEPHVNTSSTEVAGIDSKVSDHTDASISSVAPLLEKKAQSATLEDVVGEVKSINGHSNKHRRMPSGVIALVTAISFAIAIALVYIGMIAWRRYIEYRYGHRELLVNELEFDTNDLRHFEL